MSGPKLLVCGPFTDEEAARLEAACDTVAVADLSAACDLPAEGRAAIRAVAFKGHDPFAGPAMDALPALGLISNYGVGYDAIDVAAATARGVRVTNTPGVLNDDVADLTLGMTIALFRRLVDGSDLVRFGAWAGGESLPLNRKMSGSAVGIMGLGRIGREIAERFVAFKCPVHYHARSEKETPGWTYHADPAALAAAVDILVVALVGGRETENYVSRQVIGALGPRGVIVNISRGTTVDEAAMLDALETGAIGGAALDVYLNEPRIDPRFLALDNVLLQPHQGSGTQETRRAMAALQRENILRFLDGRALLTPVN